MSDWAGVTLTDADSLTAPPVVRPDRARREAAAPRFLVSRFVITSAAVFVAVAVAIALPTRSTLRQQQVERAEAASVSVLDAALILLTSLGDDVPRDLADPRLSGLLGSVNLLLDRLQGADVTVFGRDGVVVFSTDLNQMGTRPVSRQQVATWLAPREPASQVVDAPPRSRLGDRALVTRVPFQVPHLGMHVLEVARPYAPIQAAVDAIDRTIVLTTALALVVLFAFLVPMLRRTRAQLGAQATELRELLAREQAMVDELVGFAAMKDGFLTAISHELRTPLTLVRGFGMTLSRHVDRLEPTEVRALAERLDHGTERLEQVILDLIDVSRLGRAAPEVHRQPVDLLEMARDVAAGTRGAEHTITVAPGSFVAEVDGHLVKRALEHLVSNAVRHTPARTHVHVHAARTPSGIALTVSDDGPGIPAHRRADVVEPFVRFNGESPQPGTGIGLTIAHAAARAHGGALHIDASASGGARVTLVLPVAAPARGASRRARGVHLQA